MALDILSERGFRVTSEPVVRGTKMDILWEAPDKLGSSRMERRDTATRAQEILPPADAGSEILAPRSTRSGHATQ